MSLDYAFFDYRDEHYSALFRLWLIIDKLNKNRNEKLQLSLYKAQQIDQIIKHPALFKKTSELLSGSNQSRHIGEALYSLSSNQGFGAEKKEFMGKIMQLVRSEIIELIKEGDQWLLKCLVPPPPSQCDSHVHIESQIIAIKGIVSKSESIVDSLILGA